MSLNDNTVPASPLPIPPSNRAFAARSDIGENVAHIIDLIPSEQRQSLDQNLGHVQQVANGLLRSIEEFNHEQSNYTFQDYSERLLLADTQILEILEREVFQKHGTQTHLGAAFASYIKTMTGLSQVDETKFKIKVIKEFGLDNLIYERVSERYLNDEVLQKHILYYSKGKDFHAAIAEAGASAANTLILKYKDLSDIMPERRLESIKEHIKTAVQTAPDLKYLQVIHEGLLSSHQVIELLHTASELKMTNFGILKHSLLHAWRHEDLLEYLKEVGHLNTTSNLKTTYLDLGCYDTDFGYTVSPEHFPKIIKTAGEAGIREINFSGIDLWERFPYIDMDFWIECIKVAGLAGIKSLNLSGAGLYRDADIQKIQLLVQTAGFAGIKKLNLSYNSLVQTIGFKDLEIIIKTAGEAGIRDFNLSDNGYAEIPGGTHLAEFRGIMCAAGNSGMKVFHFGENGLFIDKLPRRFSEHGYLDLFSDAAASGIKNLFLPYDNLLSALSSRPAREKMIEIYEQYQMKLTYGSYDSGFYCDW